MDSEYDFYEKIGSMTWTKHASFLMILCEYALEKLKSARQDQPALQTEQQTCQNLTELVALGWDIISNPPNNLSVLDTYLSPEGEKYSEMSLFIAPQNNTDHSPPQHPTLFYTYFLIIATTGYIGSSMIEVFDRKLSGGNCYVGNVDIGLPLENALKAGLIQKNILQTFSIETDLNLESFKVS